MRLGGIQISCFFFIALTVTPSDFTLGKKQNKTKKTPGNYNFLGAHDSVFKCEVGQNAEGVGLGCCVGKFLDT